MNFQDVILTAGSIVLIAALVPSLISRHKPALMTSLMMGTVLYSFAGVYGSLGLWLAMAATAAQASLWLVLAVQRWRLSKDIQGRAGEPTSRRNKKKQA